MDHSLGLHSVHQLENQLQRSIELHIVRSMEFAQLERDDLVLASFDSAYLWLRAVRNVPGFMTTVQPVAIAGAHFHAGEERHIQFGLKK